MPYSKPLEWAAEAGQIKASIGPYLDRRMRERGAYVVGKVFPSRFDKAVRAQSIRGRMALNGLHVPTNAPWYPAFRSELLTFPAGKYDDQVDALGLIGQLLDQMMPGQPPALSNRNAIDTGYRRFDLTRVEDWMTL